MPCPQCEELTERVIANKLGLSWADYKKGKDRRMSANVKDTLKDCYIAVDSLPRTDALQALKADIRSCLFTIDHPAENGNSAVAVCYDTVASTEGMLMSRPDAQTYVQGTTLKLPKLIPSLRDKPKRRFTAAGKTQMNINLAKAHMSKALSLGGKPNVARVARQRGLSYQTTYKLFQEVKASRKGR